MKEYYHISAPESRAAIKTHGLMANQEGEIFLFESKTLSIGTTQMWVSDSIAYNQVGLVEYDIWEITPKGIKGKIEPDLVGELTAPYQHILNQTNIESSYCKFLTQKTVDIKSVFAYTAAYLFHRQSLSGRARDGTLPSPI